MPRQESQKTLPKKTWAGMTGRPKIQVSCNFLSSWEFKDTPIRFFAGEGEIHRPKGSRPHGSIPIAVKAVLFGARPKQWSYGIQMAEKNWGCLGSFHPTCRGYSYNFMTPFIAGDRAHLVGMDRNSKKGRRWRDVCFSFEIWKPLGTRWCQRFFRCSPGIGEDEPILTNILQMGRATT